MDALTILPPLLALLAGVLTIFIDEIIDKSNKIARRSMITVFASILLISCGFTIYTNYKEGVTAEIRERRIDSLLTTLKEFRSETSKGIAGVIHSMKNWGSLRSQYSPELIESALAAESEREKIISQRETVPAQQTTIRYYPKNVDKNKIRNALQVSGFNFEDGTPSLPNDETNAIWFGKNVSLDDVKFVAYTLIRAGVEVKTIKPFSSLNRKQNTIEIGTDRSFSGKNPITVTEISQKTSFER